MARTTVSSRPASYAAHATSLTTPHYRAPAGGRGQRVLSAAARLWFTVAVAGQAIFACYILLFYGGAAAQGNLSAWNNVMPRGHVPGDVVGNAVLAAHLLLAFIIIVGGAVQLVPVIRRRAPVVHRWNGRLYVTTAFAISLGGLYLVWVRGGAVGSVIQHVAISINAFLIMVCAAVAMRHARARRVAVHQRWALRLFLVVSGVWFFRVGLMLWLMVHQSPVGFDPKTFEGPFLTFLGFAQYLVPLAVLELYLRVRDSGAPAARIAMAATLVVLTVATAAGIAGATMGMWLPRL